MDYTEDYEDWVEQGRREDWEIQQTAIKVLYGGCPLCLEDDDMCKLCRDWKTECSKHRGSRWATRNLKDHAPLSPVENISIERRLFMEAIGHGHVFSEDMPDEKKPRTPNRAKNVATKKKPQVKWQDKRAARFTCQETKMKTGKGWKGRFTSQGYPRSASEWEPAELRFVYRPPGYGPAVGSDAAKKTPHCSCCHLKPCIGVEMQDRLIEMCHEHLKGGRKTVSFTQKAIQKAMQKEHCRLFMKRFLLRDPILPCIKSAAEEAVIKGISFEDEGSVEGVGGVTCHSSGYGNNVKDKRVEEQSSYEEFQFTTTKAISPPKTVQEEQSSDEEFEFTMKASSPLSTDRVQELQEQSSDEEFEFTMKAASFISSDSRMKPCMKDESVKQQSSDEEAASPQKSMLEEEEQSSDAEFEFTMSEASPHNHQW